MSEKLYDQLNIPPEVRRFLKNTRTIILILVLIILLISSIFTIDTEEVGVITRFGKYNRTVQPGLNMKIPFTEKVYRVPVERQQKLEFGFRTLKAGVNSEYERTDQTMDESLMLTGDLNLAEVEWVIQYIADKANAPVPKLDQVLDRQARTLDIIDHHPVERGQGGMIGIHQHNRHIRSRQRR